VLRELTDVDSGHCDRPIIGNRQPTFAVLKHDSDMQWSIRSDPLRRSCMRTPEKTTPWRSRDWPPHPPVLSRWVRIRQRAYSLAEQRGFRGGAELNDWLRAEKEIDREDAAAARQS
jgi:hypothetical protein